MSAGTVLICFLIGMVISIYIGTKVNANPGLFAIVFGYILAVFGLGMKPADFIAMWPTKIMFTILGICWFFGYANENGTLRKITLILVYQFRRFPSVLPWICFLISGVICMTGASPYAPNAVLMPIMIGICLSTGLSPLFGSLMVNLGAYIGSQVPWGQGASIQRSILETTQWASETDSILAGGYWTCTLFAVVSGILSFLVFRGWKARVTGDIIEKPDPMNRDQKITLVLIFIMIVLMVVLPMFVTLGAASLAPLTKKLDISLVCIVLSCVASLFHVADGKTVILKQIPWNTIMMLVGVSMLVSVATAGGAVTLIGEWIGGNVSAALIPPMFVALSAFMSVFAAGSTVVCPTMFALVPAIVAGCPGVSYANLYHGIAIGANASAISPFSGGGSLTLANIKQDDIRDRMFVPLIVSAIALSLVAVVMSALGLFA